VLKDFEFCYKHYGLAVQSMVGKEGYILACSRSDKLASVCTFLSLVYPPRCASSSRRQRESNDADAVYTCSEPTL
jgi:hypothetical protein